MVGRRFGSRWNHRTVTLKCQGITLLATATTLAEGRAIEAAGIDVIVAQGSEAGGHRGVFEPERGDAMLGVLPLVRMLMQHTEVDPIRWTT